MKKLVGIILALSLCLSMAACSNDKQETAADAAYTAGTYEAVAQGNNGDVKVNVEFTDSQIKSITIESKETTGLGDTAMETLKEKVLENQTLAVDTIAGATNSSKAFLSAIEDCVKQANGDVEALKNKEISQGEVKEETLDVDTVVVGGGAAGMSAAIRAEELGQKVVLLEKMNFTGGAISISFGNQVVTGSELQKEAGVTEDTPEAMIADFKANGANLNVDELVSLLAENVGETTDWMNAYVGAEYNMEEGLHKLAEYGIDRELQFAGKGAGVAKTMKEKLEQEGIQVLLNTKATEIIMKDGAAAGIKAAADGVNYTINADRVILATGGYGNNKDLLKGEIANALYYGPESSTGDGILMATAEDVNAATRLMEYGKRYPNGIEVSEGHAKSTIGGNIAVFNMSAILVNNEGKRIVNEKSSNRQILEAELAQEGQMGYLLMDAANFETFLSKLPGGGISEEQVNEWLANNGSKAPYFMTAATLDELAAVAKMDPETLKATVERYNGFVKNGKDEDFDRPAANMTMEIGAGPYYLVEQKPRFASTMGGLVVNDHLQVMNTNDEAISGLYAAGELVGGVMGDDSPSGANNAWALTSGKLAAEFAAEK